MGQQLRHNVEAANDDVRLLEASIGGDSDAFGMLVLRHQDRLFTTLVHVTGNREEAEDVAQEAFVQAYLKVASFRRDSAFFTWLYRIAMNIAITRGRRRRPERSLDQAREATGIEPADGGESPEENLNRAERAARVHMALSSLSEEHRAILVLRELEDCDYETIAEILDVPVGTVRSRLHRARLQLKEQLTLIHQPDHAG